MKKTLFTLWMLSVFTAWSQQSVRLSIGHQLSGAAFGSTVTAQNDLGHDFRTERLQFYLSQIELVHDGGQTTPVPNTWFLVDANVPFDESLGSFSVGTLEAIRFGVGVEQAANHLDPASYAMTHPLAPKNPSMHAFTIEDDDDLKRVETELTRRGNAEDYWKVIVVSGRSSERS